MLLDQVLPGHRLDPKAGSVDEHFHRTWSQAQSVPHGLWNYQAPCLVNGGPHTMIIPFSCHWRSHDEAEDASLHRPQGSRSRSVASLDPPPAALSVRARRAAQLPGLAGRGSAVDAVATAEPGGTVYGGDLEDLRSWATHAVGVMIQRA